MAWGATDIPDQSGRVVVVTGGNGGLGLETTRELARHGAHVVMAARNLEKAEAARAEIKAEVRAASLEVRHLDLSSLDSIRKTAAGVVADHSSIDLLVNNAGVMATPRRETSDGFELQFGTNHLGHFALTRLLMPSLLAAIAARIVSVTSTGRHFGGNVDPDDPHFTKEYGRWKAYGRSKKANLHFGFELNRRLLAAGSQARSLVAHPGLANTDLLGQSSRSTGGTGRSRTFLHNIVQRVSQSPAQGALAQLRAGTDPRAKGAQLYTPRWVASGPPALRPVLPWSRSKAKMRQLWEISEDLTDLRFDVAALVTDSRS